MTVNRPDRRRPGEHVVKRVDASTWRGEGLEAFLDEIEKDAVCEKCGGLPYDIVFTHKDVQYKFCLYKIQRGDEILAETDYEKLHEYAGKGGSMMAGRHAKRTVSSA